MPEWSVAVLLALAIAAAAAAAFCLGYLAGSSDRGYVRTESLPPIVYEPDRWVLTCPGALTPEQSSAIRQQLADWLGSDKPLVLGDGMDIRRL